MKSRSDAAQQPQDRGEGEQVLSDESWKRIAMYVALCVGVVLLRAPFIGVPMITDEGGYCYWASIWTADHQVYRDFIFGRPQGILVVYKAALALVGGSVEDIRIVAAFFTCLTACGIVLFALFSVSPRIEGFTANAEIFTLAPLVLNAYFVWNKRWFWAGIATAVAIQLKPSGFEGCVLIALWILLHWESLRSVAVATAQSLGGFVLGLLPGVLHGIWVGWAHYWYGLVTYRGQILSPDVTSLASQLVRIRSAVSDTASSWCIPALLFALALTQLPKDKRRFMLSWLVAAVVGMQIGFWWDWHFFMQIMPPLCFAGGAGLLALNKARFRVAWVAGVLLCVVPFAVRDGRLWLMKPLEISWEIYHREGYLMAEQIASHLRRTTAPDDAERRPVAPMQMYYLHSAYLTHEWEKLVVSLKAREPAAIVWVQPPPPNRMTSQEFASLVLAGYQPDRKFGDIMVFRRKPR
jgi:hypothetical protein